MAIKCCKDCRPPKRHPACWGHCPDYLKEREEDQAEKAALRKIREDENAVLATRARARYRALKKYKKN